MDFLGPDVEPKEVQEKVLLRRKFILYGWPKFFVAHFKKIYSRPISDAIKELKSEGETLEGSCRPRIAGRFSSFENAKNMDCTQHTMIENHSDLSDFTSHALDSTMLPVTPLPTTVSAPCHKQNLMSRVRTLLGYVKAALRQMLTPASLSIFISFPISLVPKLKALFIEVDGVYMPSAPDGQPPLAFIMDAAVFVGAASVPLGLICLGSALAQMKIARNSLNTLPVGAIITFAIGRMLLLPVLGVMITQGLVKGGVIPAHDKVLQFVCM